MKKLTVLLAAIVLTVVTVNAQEWAYEPNAKAESHENVDGSVEGDYDIKLPKSDVKTSTDEYTGEVITETKYVNFINGTYKLSKKNGEVYFWIQLQATTCYTVPANESFYIKLDNGEVLELSIGSRSSLPRANPRGGFTNSFIFILDAETIETLSNNKVTGIKCYINKLPNMSMKKINKGLQNNLKVLSTL